MKVIKKEKRLCDACMKVHTVKTVIVTLYRRRSEGIVCNYCNKTGAMWETEEMKELKEEKFRNLFLSYFKNTTKAE